MGTVCKELCDYGVLGVNKTDGWVVQQQQRRLSRAFLTTGEQRSCLGPCDAAHSNGSGGFGVVCLISFQGIVQLVLNF